MKRPTPTYALALMEFAVRLYGDKWQGDLARALGVPKLRIARLAAAVRADRDYHGAAQLLAELRQHLVAITTDMAPLTRGVPTTAQLADRATAALTGKDQPQ